MHPHIGLDHLTGYRFQIVKLCGDTNTVVIHYEETAWPQETEPTRRMAWTEFVDHLIQGHFEILRAITRSDG
jgi:calcineurin-like phosphoesterase family protein